VGYVSDDIQNYGYRVVTLGEDKLVLVIPAEHPLVAKKEVTLKDTIPLPMITLGEGFGITNVLNEELGNRGYSPNDLTIVSEADSIYSQLHSVFSGIGVAITSLMAAKDMEESGLVRIKEISDFRVRRPIYLIYRSELEQKQDIASILELIKKRARELITMKTTSK
jgi:DNA-binding transcriptional LysR family regulator